MVNLQKKIILVNKCSMCKGTGKIKEHDGVYYLQNHDPWYYKICFVCGGTGRLTALKDALTRELNNANMPNLHK